MGQSMRVVELRGKLTGFGLPTNGIKSDLVQRLYGYYQEQAAEQQTEEESDPKPEDEENEPEMDTESEEVSESVETGGDDVETGGDDDTSNPPDTSDGDSSQPARLSLQFGPPKAHPAGPPPEEAKPPKAGPVPLMSLEVA